MARTRRSAALDSRNKRNGLERATYHTAVLEDGCYLLYRRPRAGGAGTFFARFKANGMEAFPQEKMGQADDLAEADGGQILSYQQAKEKALALFRKAQKRSRLVEEGEPLPEGNWTVRDVVLCYIEDARRTRKDPATAENDLKAAEANILPELGAIQVAKLTAAKIRQWRDALSMRGRRKTGWRRGPEDPIEFHTLDLEDKDVLKRRKSSVNRDLSLLKSALNFAVRAGRIDAEHIPWVLVEPFRGVKGRRLRFLTPEEQRKLVMGCSLEFRPIVQGALYTGARYGELAKARVEHLDLEVGALWVDGKGRDSRPRWIFLTEEGEAFFRMLVAGRGKEETLFPHVNVPRKSTTVDRVEVEGRSRRCSRQEAEVLRLLSDSASAPVAYEVITTALWPEIPNGMKRTKNVLDQLRKKLPMVRIVRGDACAILTCPVAITLETIPGREVVTDRWLKNDTKGPMTAAYLKAGIEKVTFHELRHTYASTLINQGVPLKAIAEQLGHVDTRMVEEHYGHLAQTTKRDMIRNQGLKLGLGQGDQAGNSLVGQAP
jgi:integrase